MIRMASKNEIAAAAQIYDELFRYEAEHGSTTNWKRGIYPIRDTAAKAYAENSLYVLEIGDKICGSMILNHLQPVEYECIKWQYKANASKVLVIHTLCILPAHFGKGYGKQMIAFAVQKAEEIQCKTVRLDTWAENKPAASMYQGMGFRLAGSGTMNLHDMIQENQIYFEYEVKQDDKVK